VVAHISFLLKMSNLSLFWLARLSWSAGNWWLSAAITVIFAAFARAVRAVSVSGAIAGAVVSFALIFGAGWGGFWALCAVFLLTWIATRIGYVRKQSLGTAEPRRGRNACQVFANIGVASVCAVLYAFLLDLRFAIAVGAALSEAAADTVSSEIGQAIGGTPHLVTDWNKVPVGTDGAITLLGTMAGIAAAVLVSLTCVATHVFPRHSLWACAGAGLIGTVADSLLGATLERQGVLGNNAVNFFSTAIVALIVLLVL
jgi:uncharacterized protein (TIGR00297 family)